MSQATLTVKGQTTIPIEVRHHLMINPGDKIDFFIKPDGEVVLKPVHIDISVLHGMFKKYAKSRPVTVEEMNAAIRRKMKKK